MEGAVTRLLTDDAYGGSGVTHCLEKAFKANVEIIIPPPKTAVLGLGLKRDAHVEYIAAHGRMAWQSVTGQQPRSRGGPDRTLQGRHRAGAQRTRTAPPDHRKQDRHKVAEPHDPPRACGLQTCRIDTWGRGDCVQILNAATSWSKTNKGFAVASERAGRMETDHKRCVTASFVIVDARKPRFMDPGDIILCAYQ